MPNWVYNGLTIEGNSEQVNKLIEQMNAPYSMIHDQWNMETGQMEVNQTTYPNPIFSFHNIINHRQQGITDLEYVKQPPTTKASVNDTKAWHAEIEELGRTDNSWYNWNVRNWGTKWDVAVSSDNKYPDTYMEGPSANGDNLVVYYSFNTAWSPPMPAMAELSKQYPSLLFTLSYEEEQGWGGECEFLRGEMISNSEYESKCRDCDETNTLAYCENDCGEICDSCHWLGEADLEVVAECDTHKVYLDDEHIPAYRRVKA